jgi:tRNA (5-methylaminomethyl-2-thiouridylate)-methyltransferase
MKIAVLVSGGVDSSVALKLLKNQGYNLHAFYLKVWLEDELGNFGDCPWQEDVKYAEEVCKKLSVSLKIIPLQQEYRDAVVSYTLAEIKKGNTPSPDLFCNKLIKFGVFFDYLNNKFDKIATGHYAQIKEKNGLFFLQQPKDLAKDQTYFLSRLTQEQLKKILFPLGDLTKKEVRNLACQYNLPTKNRKDSQGICFLGKINFGDFIKNYVGERKGLLIDVDSGKKVGEHNGFWFYTVGQRKGIGLSGGPWYVVKKDSSKNIVYISNRYFDPAKSRNSFCVTDFHWIGNIPGTKSIEVDIKIRHGKEKYKGNLVFDDDRFSGKVIIDGRDQGIAPGQFAVFYSGQMCLGSAVIK